jgi:hypothetical protein
MVCSKVNFNLLFTFTAFTVQWLLYVGLLLPVTLKNSTFHLHNTGYTQKNGAVSLYSPLKPHHSFVYTLYINVVPMKEPR